MRGKAGAVNEVEIAKTIETTAGCDFEAGERYELWERRVSSGMKEAIPRAGAAAEKGGCVYVFYLTCNFDWE
jgi:hypothetical protein